MSSGFTGALESLTWSSAVTYGTHTGLLKGTCRGSSHGFYEKETSKVSRGVLIAPLLVPCGSVVTPMVT